MTRWSNDRLDYAVTATSDEFQDADGGVTGAFYGSGHGGMGVVERSDMSAGFDRTR